MIKIKTFNDNVIIKMIDSAEDTNSHAFFKDLSLPENKGEVCICTKDPKIEGQVVYFGNQYQKINLQGVEYLAMKFDNIIAIEEE